jgi:two-component system, OmpR family, KDP operon response regulator KdpE
MANAEQILIADDEETIRTTIADALEPHGYLVHAVARAEHALRVLEQVGIDLALVDLNMPGTMDGQGLLREIHRNWPLTIVIMLTGYATLDSAIAALREGAYDYLTKPTSTTQIIESIERGLAKRHEVARQQELIARLDETLRDLKRESQPRQFTLPEADRFIQTPTLTLDRHKRLAVCDGKPLSLTATEFDVLDLLARHADRVVTASELIKAVQGYDLVESDARPIARVHIQRLRRKLRDDPDAPRYVLTVRGKGYRYVG